MSSQPSPLLERALLQAECSPIILLQVNTAKAIIRTLLDELSSVTDPDEITAMAALCIATAVRAIELDRPEFREGVIRFLTDHPRIH